jgi:hypothetical protein
MGVHIDVVENDWLAGQQNVVARLTVDDGTYTFESEDPTKWLRVLGLEENPPELRDEQGATEFLARTAHKLQGTYVFATEPHTPDTCPYPERFALIRAARVPAGEAAVEGPTPARTRRRS